MLFAGFYFKLDLGDLHLTSLQIVTKCFMINARSVVFLFF